MQKALQELQSSGMTLKSNIVIEPTHLYVRFLPSSEEELQILKTDMLLGLYSYPLDYEIIQNGDYYHDPTLPDTAITWQYTVVNPDYVFPDIKHEFLAELFILEERDDDQEEITSKNGSMSVLAWEALEDKALEITGNIEEGNSSNFTEKASKWRPAGCIKVRDNIAGDIALVGAMVRARRWFTTHKGYTDSKGNFSCDGRFRRDANYSIKWERKCWDIRSGTWGQALYNGPKKRGNWDFTITSRSSLRYATIHRAAYRHFYGNNLGIPRPYRAANGRWKICYFDKDGSGDFWGNTGSPGAVLPDIRIYGYRNGVKKDASLVFRTTTHKLGHASHCVSMGNVNYWQVSKIIYECWADAVEWALTNQEYEELGPKYPYNSLAMQYWPYESSSSTVFKDKIEYSSLFVDLVDSYNQSGRNTTSRTYPNDSITGYSMKNLSSIVKKSYGLSSLKTNLKAAKPNNVTNNQIDELFKRYEEKIW